MVLTRIRALLGLTMLLLAAEIGAQDFANLERYRRKNTALLNTGREVEVVILGDSITDRWPRQRPHFFEETGWIGRGISRETTPQMLLRFHQDVIALRPEVVIILAGTNDVAGNSGEMSVDDTLYYLDAMVHLARAHNIQPVLCKLLPAAEFPWSPGRNPVERIPALNARIEDYAAREKLMLVNFFDVMKDRSGGMRRELSEDGVHPNNLGYATMESRLKVQLAPLFPASR